MTFHFDRRIKNIFILNETGNKLYITETSPYLLGYFRKFISNIVFELSSKYLQKNILSILKHTLIRSIFDKNYYC